MRLRHTQFDKAKQKNENKYHKIKWVDCCLRPILLAFFGWNRQIVQAWTVFKVKIIWVDYCVGPIQLAFLAFDWLNWLKCSGWNGLQGWDNWQKGLWPHLVHCHSALYWYRTWNFREIVTFNWKSFLNLFTLLWLKKFVKPAMFAF